jgi:hypothetical protein
VLAFNGKQTDIDFPEAVVWAKKKVVGLGRKAMENWNV